MARQFPTIRRKEIYKGVAEVVGKSPGKTEWSDEELTGLKSISLTVLTNEDMLRECRIFLYGLHVKMSPRSIASALLLTWNMRSTDPVEARIFPTIDPGSDPVDHTLRDFEEENAVYTDNDIEVLIEGVSAFEVRRSCSFLAASTLKMFAKDASGWSKAWDSEHFRKRYEGFTKKAFPLMRLVPVKTEVDVMYEAYQGQKLYLGTLGRILYSLADVQDTRQTEMLFEQHLSCTGLHIISQFINAKISLGASTEDLLSALDMRQNEPTLLQLKNLIDTSLSKPSGPNNRGTWRFSRLFDPNAYPLLQTKYAQDTVAVLAHINNISRSSTSLSNPLQIAVLRQMGQKRLKDAKAVAHNIYHYFTVTERASANEFYDIDQYNLEESEYYDEEEEPEEAH